ncbi:hypothetical protein CBL_04316 [Carabus blaptoides fortunei]
MRHEGVMKKRPFDRTGNKADDARSMAGSPALPITIKCTEERMMEEDRIHFLRHNFPGTGSTPPIANHVCLCDVCEGVAASSSVFRTMRHQEQRLSILPNATVDLERAESEGVAVYADEHFFVPLFGSENAEAKASRILFKRT